MDSSAFLHFFDVSHDVVAFSTRRNGAGVSVGGYGQMNVCPYCGDKVESVRQNTTILADSLGIDATNIIIPHQIHSTEIRIVDKGFLTSLLSTRNAMLDGIDAIITSERNVCIGVSTADCVPLLLYDTKEKVIAAIHAGWRGTVKRIAEKCVTTMKEQFNSNTSDIKAVIGPSISKTSFEVGDEVYKEFEENEFQMSSMAELINGRWHIDLWEANRIQLVDMGIRPSEIQVSGICTYINHKKYFSARRLTINSGRIFTGIMMTE